MEFSAKGISNTILLFCKKYDDNKNNDKDIASPPISFFIFLIEFPSLIFNPPVSKVTPFPIITIGLSFLLILLLETCKKFGLTFYDFPTAYVSGKFFLI